MANTFPLQGKVQGSSPSSSTNLKLGAEADETGENLNNVQIISVVGFKSL